MILLCDSVRTLILSNLLNLADSIPSVESLLCDAVKTSSATSLERSGNPISLFLLKAHQKVSDNDKVFRYGMFNYCTYLMKIALNVFTEVNSGGNVARSLLLLNSIE